MIDASSFAIVVDHGYELCGQKKLAQGVDGRWYVWVMLTSMVKPEVAGYDTECAAFTAYKAIKLEKTSVHYTPSRIPHIIDVSDVWWNQVEGK